jgi:4-aminobutyrate aminotransferase-like enzyme
MDDEKLQLRAKLVGDYYKKELNKLKDNTCFIGDVRGSGLFLGIEITTSTGDENPTLAQKIKNGLRDKFILVGTDGEFNNVIKTKPPLCFSRQNVDQVVKEISIILNEN